jgi:hypothetical protein
VIEFNVENIAPGGSFDFSYAVNKHLTEADVNSLVEQKVVDKYKVAPVLMLQGADAPAAGGGVNFNLDFGQNGFIIMVLGILVLVVVVLAAIAGILYFKHEHYKTKSPLGKR